MSPECGPTPRPDSPPAIRPAGVGESYPVGTTEHLFRLTGDDTGGRFAIENFVVPAGASGVPPHIHDAHDEYFYILKGTLTLFAGDAEIDAGPGAVAAAVRGMPHGYRNRTKEPVHALCMYTPAGYENYFREVHAAIDEGAELNEELLTRLRKHYATRPCPPSDLNP
jgi:quercetin dioxygenase-like cupin family protein